tara:strand:+ start:5900 stop:6076 length:177 start_codon:yes stop_codon:yes gene_type:complete
MNMFWGFLLRTAGMWFFAVGVGAFVLTLGLGWYLSIGGCLIACAIAAACFTLADRLRY